MKIFLFSLSRSIMMFLFMIASFSCSTKERFNNQINSGEFESEGEKENLNSHLSVNNYVRDIVNHSAFKGFGELLLPLDDNSGYYNTSLSNIGSLMPYHSNIHPDIIIGAVNHMIDEVTSGKIIFYNFYTEQQKQQDPGKRNTGLFFYRGNPDAPFAVVCPGGGFSYVGSLHEGLSTCMGNK